MARRSCCPATCATSLENGTSAFDDGIHAMTFESPEIVDGINARRERAMRDLILLLVAGLVGIVATIYGVLLAGGFLIRVLMPMEAEAWLGRQMMGPPVASAPQAELQDLADRLAVHMDLPDDLEITVHYNDDATINAFAFIGGHVMFHRGLLEHLPHENAVAMVMAHEIAHAKHRDPLSAMGSTLMFQFAMALFLGDAGWLSDQAATGTGQLFLLQFSRDAERRADETGLAAVAAEYGHVAGADDLFRQLSKMEEEMDLPHFALLSTHPDTDSRIEAVEAIANDNGWPVDGPTTPLTPVLDRL